MGNCTLKGVTGECHYSIRVLSDWGSLLQFKGPITVGEVLRRHQPGYGIFRQGHTSSPLPEHESLSYGLLYYLLPLKPEEVVENTSTDHHGDPNQEVEGKGCEHRAEEGGTNENKEKQGRSPDTAESEYVKNLSNGSALEVLPSAGNGVWKVKLVIDTKQLEEILSEQVNTEALIEKMRMAASATSSSPTRSRRTMSPWKLGWKPPTLFNNTPIIKERLSTPSCLNKSTL
ncbi:uncharacterized protein LOC114731677 [Neltuma alba]|uniref:uncharacterized protein LOC114731677 n=1 Tax=Neltuma alba TaxID=207710 RepID=UPI0010A2D38D|nr:uncharacterized protein LOC114731677 [Prosopis alba]